MGHAEQPYFWRSKIIVLSTGSPLGPVPFWVTVMVLPSEEIERTKVDTIFPPFLSTRWTVLPPANLRATVSAVAEPWIG